MKCRIPIARTSAARTAVTYMAPYTRLTQSASMSAMMAAAAMMDATARTVPALPPTKAAARNATPVTAVSTPLIVRTKLERSIMNRIE